MRGKKHSFTWQTRNKLLLRDFIIRTRMRGCWKPAQAGRALVLGQAQVTRLHMAPSKTDLTRAPALPVTSREAYAATLPLKPQFSHP